MFIRNPNHSLSFSLFTQYPQVCCAISTRGMGSLNIHKVPPVKADSLTKQFGSQFKSVYMEQVHGSEVRIIGPIPDSIVAKGVDGLVTQKKNILLGVNAADCVPLFFYDPKQQIVATAHAGWKGTSKKIAVGIIEEMNELGSATGDILVAIGPHIGACCYNISEVRAQLFQEQFAHDTTVLSKQDGDWYLDIGQANRQQLINRGIKPEQIDSPVTCTSCKNDQFFSYRKDSEEMFGEMLGVIGMKV